MFFTTLLVYSGLLCAATWASPQQEAAKFWTKREALEESNRQKPNVPKRPAPVGHTERRLCRELCYVECEEMETPLSNSVLWLCNEPIPPKKDVNLSAGKSTLVTVLVTAITTVIICVVLLGTCVCIISVCQRVRKADTSTAKSLTQTHSDDGASKGLV